MTKPVPCLWAEDEDGMWQTKCEQTFMFIDGVPEDNNFRFCPYCGHPLQQMLLDESPEEYEEEDTCDAP